MISVEEARTRILAPLKPLPTEIVPVSEGLGRVLARDAVARLTHPPADVSAMDGYAVRAADTEKAPTTLTVVGEAPAGQTFGARLEEGQALRIFTGGTLPEGADAIVIQEETEQTGDRVTIRASVALGAYVRPAGLDFRAGESLIPAGKPLSVRDIGLAAAMNLPWLAVRRQPRIAVLATGDEVVLPGEPLNPGQIVSSNGFALGAFINAFGGEVINLGIAPDDPETLETVVEGARGSDLIVTTGGASVGDHDLVRKVLGEGRMSLDFWKIAMRPGKPLLFGQIGGTPLLGLPGNPVSTIVCAVVFLRAALARMSGLESCASPTQSMILEADLPENDRRQDYLRARFVQGDAGGIAVRPFERQDSSMLRTLCDADCLIVRPPFAPAAQAGDTVEVISLAGGNIGV